jgi:O-methyltransferase domain/Dimerisation domain
MATTKSVGPSEEYVELMNLLEGFMVAQAIYVAAKLDLAGLLQAGPRLASDLAAEVGCDAFGLERLMYALAGRGIFSQDADGRFSLTSLGALLQKGALDSAWPMAVVHGELLYPIWGELLHTVKTGRRADEVALGADSWRFMQSNPELGSAFHAFMSERATRRAEGLLASYRFPAEAVVVDVGGGDGTLLELLLAAHDGLQGVLLEETSVAFAAARRLDAAGLGSRCEVVSGDMFLAVPANGDFYILSVVLHDWDDEDALRILARCREAMKAESKLIIIEIVLPDSPSRLHMTDLNLFVGLAGHERTEGNWRALLEQAGFSLESVTPGPRYSYIEAQPSELVRDEIGQQGSVSVESR